ncbi:bifunctional riboflavin kinase/FAD synthetase [Snodgrassella communis]|uniref:bifunctional riboflavin kinase/FAD synthetase n=1 Tax=Snodgrassella communis TaxID=2946699 RepID=UPI00286CAEEB|nr:bifunctional riboflavin kinase/FAD synthetase [Snodgrassella communis]WMY92451.1 bifunctional riboflavin kinase/FAD synthetase [Snodgrassella communis]
MQVWLGSGQQPDWSGGTAVTIGNFDGVHCGHRHILLRLRQEACQRGLGSVVMIFEPQPQEFFAQQAGKTLPFRLTPLRDKLNLLAASGCVDAVYVLRFNQQFASMQPMDFIRQMLMKQLSARYLLVGDDFRFGANREGDFALLQEQTSFVTERTPSVLVEDVRASSTAVRMALAAGNLAYARLLLGHDYTLSGRVKHGAKLGRELGCPTANIHLPALHYALNGVFVVDVVGAFGRKRGVASFGKNPTVSAGSQQKLEVHIFDCADDLYGQRLQVHFLHKLRDELKFDSLTALQVQIFADMDAARIWQAT